MALSAKREQYLTGRLAKVKAAPNFRLAKSGGDLVEGVRMSEREFVVEVFE